MFKAIHPSVYSVPKDDLRLSKHVISQIYLQSSRAEIMLSPLSRTTCSVFHSSSYSFLELASPQMAAWCKVMTSRIRQMQKSFDLNSLLLIGDDTTGNNSIGVAPGGLMGCAKSFLY